MSTVSRRAYAEMFGPTTGDRLRLADTDALTGLLNRRSFDVALARLAAAVTD